ncbi:hypothetical protein ACP275_13G157600 [Erythranthe tilingii]
MESFWVRVQNGGKKQCRSLLWRIKAAIKNNSNAVTMRNNRSKGKRFKFQYDPHSYALNFDDGCYNSHRQILIGGETKIRDFHHAKLTQNGCPEITIWVYVLWVESY